MSTTPLPATLPRLPAHDARFADSLAPEARIRELDLGPGLWAVERTGPDTQVLYVHNPTNELQAFYPATVFGGDVTPVFLSGDITTAGEEGAGLIVRLAPKGDVWLARTATTDEETP
ncbi:hypothetical protein [Streptomyces sp. NBC_01708]|uniref:hypothetical protein n=1 Tax=Streptomyces sp. NBC_01708 TaxID=2975915 RepID=UPI002E30BB4F|nr:hypothetical protein [Streptomyces sp. NBC_01708]